jgi:hypothetical protein
MKAKYWPCLGVMLGFLSARYLIHQWIHLRLDQEAQMNVRYRVTLTQDERDELGALLCGGKQGACKLKRARTCWPPMRA